MPRIRAPKIRTKPARAPHPSRRARKLDAAAPRHLRAMSKQGLVALVLDLQARLANGASAPSDAGTVEAVAQAPASSPTSLVIAASVRSGQAIDFPHGDVTVIGSVGSGAEIVAGGSIHVYGTLRGRAVAGTSGDRKARIFCQNLQAELLSIDGCYRVAENFDPKLRGRPMQAHLDGMRMTLVPLDSSDAGPEERASTGSVQQRAAERFKHFMSLGAARPNAPAEFRPR